MTDPSQPEPASNLKYQATHISGIERAFGSGEEPSPRTPEEIAQAEALKQQVMKDREEFIKLYQPGAMSYIRGVLAKMPSGSVDVNQEVGIVWSNLVTRLLEGNFRSFRHTGKEGSFRAWLRRVIANECKEHLKQNARVLGKTGPKQAHSLGEDHDIETFDPEDRTLEEVLRKTVIERTYEAMEDDGLYGAAVLYAAKSQGEFTSESLAAHLSETSGKSVSVDAAKKRLQRGRELFAQTLVEQVGKLDGTEDLDRIEETLIELDLMKNCRKALAAMRGQSK